MKIISIFNNKGGVGKTTTTKYLAKHLANKNKRVLIIDLDSQSNLSSQFLTDNLGYTVTDLLITDVLTTDVIKQSVNKNIFIISSDLSLQRVNNQILLESHIKNAQTRLKTKLDQINNEFDYVLIDCAPTIDLLVTNALVTSDEIIIPIKADSYSINGITMMLEEISNIKNNFNSNLKIGGIFLNQNKRNSKLHKEIFKLLNENIDSFIPTFVGDYSIVANNTFSEDEKIEKHQYHEQLNELFSEMGY